MTSAAGWALETTYPDPTGWLMAMLSATTELAFEHAIPVGCIADYSHHSHLLIVTLVPLGVITTLVLCSAVLARINLEGPSNKCYATALLIAFLVTPTASTTVFRTFHCDSLDDGRSFLVAVSASAQPTESALILV